MKKKIATVNVELEFCMREGHGAIAVCSLGQFGPRFFLVLYFFFFLYFVAVSLARNFSLALFSLPSRLRIARQSRDRKASENIHHVRAPCAVTNTRWRIMNVQVRARRQNTEKD